MSDRVRTACPRKLGEAKAARLHLGGQLLLREMMREVGYQIVAELHLLATSHNAKGIRRRGGDPEGASGLAAREERQQDRCAVSHVCPQLLQEADTNRPVLHQRVTGPTYDRPIARWDDCGAFVSCGEGNPRLESFAREELVRNASKVRMAFEGDDVEPAALQGNDLTTSAC